MRHILILTGLIVLAACASGGMSGKGPITLSANTKAALERYMSQTYPRAFMVTADGRISSWSYCGDSRCVGNETQLAYDGCRNISAGRECFMYAEGKRIVWQE